jgi:protein SCO1/2
MNRTSICFALSLAVLLCTAPAMGAEDHSGHQMASSVVRSEHAYPLPDVKVINADGKRMTLAQAIDDGRPVVLNFIYTSCNAICPVTSQVFYEFREKLGAESGKVNMVSLSIDPEQDTPRRLTEYAKRFGGAGVWSYYTSSSGDAMEIQRAFAAWRGDKMNHQPTTFLRAAPGRPWVRLDGFVSPEAMVAEYRKTVSRMVPDNCGGSSKNASSASQTAGAASINSKCKS